jgi:hypothetical protein
MSNLTEITPPRAWVWSHYRGIIEAGPEPSGQTRSPAAPSPAVADEPRGAGTAPARASWTTGLAAAGLLLLVLGILWLISS